MKKTCISLFLASAALLTQPAMAADPGGVTVKPVMAKDLSDFPGKEA